VVVAAMGVAPAEMDLGLSKPSVEIGLTSQEFLYGLLFAVRGARAHDFFSGCVGARRVGNETTTPVALAPGVKAIIA
jgi:hypothetical protein